MSTSDATPRFAYDLFVSYAHADDHDGWVGALVESIQAEHATFTTTPQAVLFDSDEIRRDLARDDGDLPAARRLDEDSLAIWRRFSQGSPEKADYARGTCILYARLADLAERETDPVAAESWWRQAYEILAGMKHKGLFVSAEDEGFLHYLEKKLGIQGGGTDE